ncbi:uncharacterized protein N7518_009267 [Penicillium psychrosexuale]|uniref:uncharacterized protein n=1 Tax=Penicillium psychrosexuale TaxID=1002107 RepID=UPI0025459FF7|nr:uncharacterized protein N7518_009267 [Penicillium psychrosexuale]KAJ5783590.1 hypothetical protein N7518_009267 [Penicillium psychrosexuale]
MSTWIKQFGLRPGPRKWRATGKHKGKLEIKNMLGLHDDPPHSPITSKSSPITKKMLNTKPAGKKANVEKKAKINKKTKINEKANVEKKTQIKKKTKINKKTKTNEKANVEKKTKLRKNTKI